MKHDSSRWCWHQHWWPIQGRDQASGEEREPYRCGLFAHVTWRIQYQHQIQRKAHPWITILCQNIWWVVILLKRENAVTKGTSWVDINPKSVLRCIGESILGMTLKCIAKFCGIIKISQMPWPLAQSFEVKEFCCFQWMLCWKKMAGGFYLLKKPEKDWQAPTGGTKAL